MGRQRVSRDQALRSNDIVRNHQKKPPGKEHMNEQMAQNKDISGRKKVAEHDISGMRRYGGMSGTY